MPYALCPSCNDDIYLPRRPRLQERVECPSCGARLEVIDVNPLELDWPADDADDEQEEEEGQRIVDEEDEHIQKLVGNDDDQVEYLEDQEDQEDQEDEEE